MIEKLIEAFSSIAQDYKDGRYNDIEDEYDLLDVMEEDLNGCLDDTGISIDIFMNL